VRTRPGDDTWPAHESMHPLDEDDRRLALLHENRMSAEEAVAKR
jgi:hypothetical protein